MGSLAVDNTRSGSASNTYNSNIVTDHESPYANASTFVPFFTEAGLLEFDSASKKMTSDSADSSHSDSGRHIMFRRDSSQGSLYRWDPYFYDLTMNTELVPSKSRIVNPALADKKWAAIHVRATDNRGRWRHSVCKYADKLDYLLRTYKAPDPNEEWAKLLETPGGWYNSLERLYEDASVGDAENFVSEEARTKALNEKKNFTFEELVQGRSDPQDETLVREMKRLAERAERATRMKDKKRKDGSRKPTGQEPVSPLQPGTTGKLFCNRGPNCAPGTTDEDTDEHENTVSTATNRTLTGSKGLPPTKTRLIFVATDNCTVIEEFSRCEAYKRNKWELRSFCEEKIESDSAEDQPHPEWEFGTKQGISPDEFVEESDSEPVLPGERMARLKADLIQRSEELVDCIALGECEFNEAENIPITAQMRELSESPAARTGPTFKIQNSKNKKLKNFRHPARGLALSTMYRLWAEILLLKEAPLVVATFSSNMGRLVQVLREQPQTSMLSLDSRWKPG